VTRRIAFALLILICAAIVGSEISLRLLGFTDFPLYEKSDTLGYILAPNQHGVFLNRNDWVFNELSMGVADRFQPKKYTHNVLLIGDSIVLGGDPIAQKDKIAPILNNRCETAMTWPIAAGSWAFLNELRYLELHQDILDNLDRIVFILNSADFGQPSVWASEVTHPTHRPLALIQLARKLNLVGDVASGEGKGTGDWHEAMKWLADRYHRPVTILLYPTEAETRDANLRARALDAHAAELDPRFNVIFLKAEISDWSDTDYRDKIHPKASSDFKIADLLKKHIPECREN
jgi:hypothetical protein